MPLPFMIGLLFVKIRKLRWRGWYARKSRFFEIINYYNIKEYALHIWVTYAMISSNENHIKQNEKQISGCGWESIL